MIHFILLFSRQGKIRLQKWFNARPEKEKKKIARELINTVLARHDSLVYIHVKPKMCNFLEWRELRVVYKRYASLFFLFVVDSSDNELIVLELIHRYVEVLDKYFGSVCELDIIFNFEKAYFVLDELIVAGEMQETSKKAAIKEVEFADNLQEEEVLGLALKDVGLI